MDEGKEGAVGGAGEGGNEVGKAGGEEVLVTANEGNEDTYATQPGSLARRIRTNQTVRPSARVRPSVVPRIQTCRCSATATGGVRHRRHAQPLSLDQRLKVDLATASHAVHVKWRPVCGVRVIRGSLAFEPSHFAKMLRVLRLDSGSK